MTIFRPATPGFLVTLTAAILLAVVVFCVPYVKSVYFLKAAIDYQGASANITFGTLGYCIELSGNTTCSSPSIGYQLDINGLVGNSLPVQIPQVAVKWLTYALFLHAIALALAAVSALFGLLAHIREMAMTCCSTCFSGFAATVALVAFAFDLGLFFVAKARINAIGKAQTGNAMWLTLSAGILLMVSGCFYTFGRCCMRGRPSGGTSGGRKWYSRDTEGGDNNYGDQTRLDAIKAEADRKAMQKQGEVGLPAFYETQPLTAHVEGEHVYLEGEHSHSKPDPSPPAPSTSFKGGYAPGPTGTRTVDDYYRSDSSPAYPPQREVRRQQSEHSSSSYNIPATTTASPPINYAKPSGYGQYNSPPTSTSPPLPNNQLFVPSGYGQYNNAPASTSPPPSNNQLFVPSGYHQSYNSTPDPYGREYGHTAGGTSYHTAISHDQGPSSYQPMHDPYAAYQQHSEPTTLQHNHFISHTPVPQTTSPDYYPPLPTSTSPPPIQQPQPLFGDRSYTLGGDGYSIGGDGYGSNQVPPLPEPAPTLPPGAGAPSYLANGQHLPPIDTNAGAGYMPEQYFHTSPGPNEAPPGYEPSGQDTAANWGKR